MDRFSKVNNNNNSSNKKNLRRLPFGLKFRSSKKFIVTVIAFSLFTDFFLYGIIVPVIPFALKDRIELSDPDEINNLIGILLTVEAISSVIFSPISGLIADYGNGRRAFISGLLALCVSTGLLCFGRTLALLVMARMLQGISAAIVWTVGLTLLIDTVGTRNLGSVFSMIHSTISLGTLTSPLIGGIVYAKFGYYAVYGISGGLLVFDLILRLFMIEKSSVKELVKSGQVDERTALIDSGEDQEEEGEDQNRGNGTFVDVSKDEEQLSGLFRVFPFLVMLNDWNLLACLFVSFTQATLLASFDATLPLYAHERFGYESFGSGMLFGALQLTFILANPVFGWWADNRGGRGCVVLGSIGLAPLLIILSLPQKENIVAFVLILGAIGIGFGAISSPAFVEANLTVSRKYEANRDRFGSKGPYGQLYAINNIMFGLGMSAGPLMSCYLVEKFGFKEAMIGLAVLSLGTGLIALFGIQSRSQS